MIAIDGPGGAGKSTIARRVAERLGFVYIDTGAMYRAIALAALRAGLADTPARLDAGAIASLAEAAEVSFTRTAGQQRVLLNGEDVTADLRTPEVDRLVPFVAGVPEVRRALAPQQRRLGASGGVVVDGRDVGTAVLPDAEYKFFVTADLTVRARRRHAELWRRGERVPMEAVERSLAERDEMDSSRGVAPLRRAEDAVLLDTTHLTVDEAVERVLRACPAAAAAGAPGGDGGGQGR